jgi:hypothetical protein
VTAIVHANMAKQSWKSGATIFASLAVFVLIINIIMAALAVHYHKANSSDDSFVLYEGDCSRVRHLNIAMHLLINVLGTALLSGSNYCMQCLSAPTRSDVDTAHAKRDWLDIGIHSVRNLYGRIGWVRTILWLILGLSSLPLHLL